MSMERLGVASAALAVLAACGGEGNAAHPARVLRQTLGDTVRVTSSVQAEGRFVADSMEVLWRSPELEDPTGMAALSDGWAVLDPSRVHLLGSDGTLRVTASREGNGPGELSHARAVGVRNDTVFVLDSGNRRLSLFDRDGAFLTSRGGVVLPAEAIPLGPSSSAFRLGFRGTGVLLEIEGELVVPGAISQRGIAWAAFDSDSIAVVVTMDDRRLMDLGPIRSDPDPYGPRAHLAVGRDGRYATADGQQYCGPWAARESCRCAGPGLGCR